MNSIATPTTPVLAESGPIPDAFAEAVRDILTEATKRMEVARDSVGGLVDQIVDAYVPRIKLERERTKQAFVQIRDLIIRDRMLHEHLGQMRRSLDKINNSQVRYAAHAADLGAKLGAVRLLVREADDAGADTVTIAHLTEALGTDTTMPRMLPSPVSFVSCDTRWAVGYFMPDGGGRRVSFPFIGWSVVLRSAVPETVIESVFMVDGAPVVQSELVRRGLTLERIM